MNIEVLKEILYAEHEREKKISIRNYILVGTLAVVVFTSVIFLFSLNIMAFFSASPDNKIPVYVRIIAPLMLLGVFIYPTIILSSSLKRPKMIEEVLVLFEQKKYGDNFRDEKVFKTIIPLIKFTIKLSPFNYLNFTQNGKIFKLPVPLQAIPDIRSTLSGADMGKVYGVWNELYADGKNGEVENNILLKSLEEFRVFARETLNERGAVMEIDRKKSVNYLKYSMLFIVVLMGGIMYYVYSNSVDNAGVVDGSADSIAKYTQNQTSFTYKILGGFAILCALSYAYHIKQKKKYASVAINDDGSSFTGFKDNIFKKMVHFINPDFEYIKNSYVGLPEIMDTQMFIDKNYTIGGNDLIVGKHNNVPFQYSDVDLHYKANFSEEKAVPDEVFAGQYFVAKFNKNFREPVYVFSKKSLKGLFTNNSIHDYLNTALPKVILEDPEFNKDFDVYCNDQVMARYVLSTSLMQRIKDLTIQEKKAQLFISFHNNKVSVLNNTKQDKFETGIFTVIKPELLEGIYLDLYRQLSIIEELKLNINIWNP